MNPVSQGLTRDGLIQKGLEGRDNAIAAYDDMLWKIRTGYAAVLYGVFTLVVGLGDKRRASDPVGSAQFLERLSACDVIVVVVLSVTFTLIEGLGLTASRPPRNGSLFAASAIDGVRTDMLTGVSMMLTRRI